MKPGGYLSAHRRPRTAQETRAHNGAPGSNTLYMLRVVCSWIALLGALETNAGHAKWGVTRVG